MFARIGLPPHLVADSIDRYVAATCRLIDEAEWRRHCTRICIACNLDAAFFHGKPELFSELVFGLLK